MPLVSYGKFAALPDKAAANLMRVPSELRSEVDARIGTQVQPLVATALADPNISTTIANAAGQAVEAKIAAEDLITSNSGRILPDDELVYFGPLPTSTGYSWGVIMRVRATGRRYVALGVKLSGDIGGRVAGTSAAANVLATIRDIIYGWWSGPVIETNAGFYATSGLGRVGDSMAIDVDFHGIVSAARIGMNGMVDPDDHNPPSRMTVRDVNTGYVRGGIAQLKNHGTETSFRVVTAPGRGRAVDFLGRPEVTVPIGSMVSYGFWWHLRHAQTATTDDMFLMLRNDVNWGIRDMRIDWAADGQTTQLGAYKRVLQFTQQPYVTANDGKTTADGHQTARLAAGYNPTATRHEVYLLDFDLQTGDVFDLKNRTTVHNIYTSAGYLSDNVLIAALPNTGAGTRRLLDVRPASAGDNWGLLTVEYPGAVGPDGVYTEYEFDEAGNIVATRTWGRVGAHLERYPAGAKYGMDGSVWHINEANGIYTLSRNGVLVRKSTSPMFRVHTAPPGGPVEAFVNQFEKQGDYKNYLEWARVTLLAVSREALK